MANYYEKFSIYPLPLLIHSLTQLCASIGVVDSPDGAWGPMGSLPSIDVLVVVSSSSSLVLPHSVIWCSCLLLSEAVLRSATPLFSCM